MSFIRKHSLFLLILAGLLFRLSILFYDASWDVNNHLVWARDLWQRGASGFYETQSSNVFAYLYPNYPSLAIYLFALVYPLARIIHDFFWWINLNVSFFPSNLIFFFESEAFLKGVMKLPGIMADVGVAYLVYLFAQKIVPRNKKLLLWAPSIILFNPAFIYNSALWGQIDAVPIFFVLVSVYSFMFGKNYFLPAFWLVVALLIKPTALVFLPLLAVIYYKKYGLKKNLISLFFVNLIFWLSFLPFYKSGGLLAFPYRTYLFGILEAQSLSFVTNGAFNFWLILTQFKGVKDTVPFLLEIPYRFWGYLIVGLINLTVIYRALKNKSLFLGLFMVSFAAFLFLTKMHERYSLLPLVFLLLASFKKTGFIKWFVVLSLLSFLNHYHSWAVPKVELLFNILDHPAGFTALSAFSVFIFLYFLKKGTALNSYGKTSRIAHV